MFQKGFFSLLKVGKKTEFQKEFISSSKQYKKTFFPTNFTNFRSFCTNNDKTTTTTAQPPPPPPIKTLEEKISLFAKSKIFVSQIKSIEIHPNASSLYVCQIESKNQKTYQLCAGLLKYYSIEELNGKKVCTVMNLKPAKLKGVLSSAMILAGSTEDGQVKVLEPPLDSNIGDTLYLKGYKKEEEIKEIKEGEEPIKEEENFPQNLSSKIWTEIVKEFKVINQKATFADIPLVTDKGFVTVPLPDHSKIY